jgi:hypothetical protein
MMTDLFREIEQRVEARRTARIRASVPLTFPGEKQRPKLTSLPKPKPHVPASEYRLRASHIAHLSTRD